MRNINKNNEMQMSELFGYSAKNECFEQWQKKEFHVPIPSFPPPLFARRAGLEEVLELGRHCEQVGGFRRWLVIFSDFGKLQRIVPQLLS